MKEDFFKTVFTGFTVLFIAVCLFVGFLYHTPPAKEKPILEPISDAEYERWKNLPEPVVQLPENYSLTFILPDGRKVELSPKDTENVIEKALKEGTDAKKKAD